MRKDHDRDEIRTRLNGRRLVASVSGGKDSAAMSLYLTELGLEHDRVFMDTGWEHDLTYEYLRGDLAKKLGPIAEISGPLKMEELALKKGMFPSRVRRYCTQELKVYPLQKHIASLVEAGDDVCNLVGIRAGESLSRSKMSEWEWSDGFDCETWRPIFQWTEQDVIDIHREHDLRPNPLYLMGASRVGCWPCIYARKSEIKMIADIDPARIDRIRALEKKVGDAQLVRIRARGEEPKHGPPAWFQNPMPERHADGTRNGTCWPIDKVVEWSRTSHGGRQFELFAADPADAGCMRWGLCETDAPEEP